MSYPIAEKRPLRIGHRGAAAYAPHNSLAGFRKAAALKADMVELDVQRSADNHFIWTQEKKNTLCQKKCLSSRETWQRR